MAGGGAEGVAGGWAGGGFLEGWDLPGGLNFLREVAGGDS